MRSTSASPIKEIMAVMVLNAPVSTVENYFRDISSQKRYINECEESSLVPGMNKTRNVYYLYTRFMLGAPIDFVSRWEWRKDVSTGLVTAHIEAFDSNYRYSPAARIPLYYSDIVLIPIGPHQTELNFSVLIHPGQTSPDMSTKHLLALMKDASRNINRHFSMIMARNKAGTATKPSQEIIAVNQTNSDKKAGAKKRMKQEYPVLSGKALPAATKVEQATQPDTAATPETNEKKTIDALPIKREPKENRSSL